MRLSELAGVEKSLATVDHRTMALIIRCPTPQIHRCPTTLSRYDNRAKWYLGNVASVNPDGTIDVTYDSAMWNGWVRCPFAPQSFEGSLLRATTTS